MLAIKELLLSTPLVESHLKKTRIPPSFFLLGFQKCGTTSLYRYISQQVGFAPAKQKEVDTMTDGSYSLGKFLSYFPKKSEGSFTGNASHMMSFVPGGLDYLQQEFPEAKLLAVVRNPIERAFSHYNYDKASADDPKRRTMNIPNSFDEAVAQELELLESIDDYQDLSRIYALTSEQNGYGMPISRGLYYYYLNDFAQQGLEVLTLSIEEIEADFELRFSQILTHIGIDKEQHVIPKPKRFNAAQKELAMSENTRTLLNKFFKPHNEKLYEFLGRDLAWN